MRKIVLFPSIGAILLLLSWLWSPFTPLSVMNEEKPVAEVLVELGDEPLPHQVDFSIPGVSVDAGRRLVLEGIGARKNGKASGRQSKHFVCTSCHNVEREDPDLSKADPEARLPYVQSKGLPFLQGSALYGVVNRTSFYNGDYDKKYGDLVLKARNNLREAIQLCATECAQGRILEDWELESVLAYLWTIDLKLGDLNLSGKDMDKLERALRLKKPDTTATALIKEHYLQASPATFVTPPEDRTVGYAEEGDAENGRLLYELSCLHCHERQRYSFFELDNSDMSFEFLLKHLPRYTRYSAYQVIRYGTSPLNGKRAYMPHYTLEKMSNSQVEDLRAYIEMRANEQEVPTSTGK